MVADMAATVDMEVTEAAAAGITGGADAADGVEDIMLGAEEEAAHSPVMSYAKSHPSSVLVAATLT